MVILFFTFLAIFSALALDYINWEEGKKSYIFSSLIEKKNATLSQEELKGIILRILSSYEVDTRTIHQYIDRKHKLHIKIDLPLKVYSLLENTLVQEFEKIHSSVIKREEQETREKKLYLWEIQARSKENLVILFSCSKQNLEDIEEARGKSQKLRKNRVAIIVDDMGYSLYAAEKITSLEKPLTFSILPFSPYAGETAEIAHENGLEVMLHLPLQSVNNRGEEDYEGIILSGMSGKEIREALVKNFLQVPYVKGVNNHMGSKITADGIIMRIILEQLKERSLFFIDSLTTSRSVAFKMAQEMGIPSARRHIFLDSISDEGYIKRKMIDLFLYAQQHGSSIGICHPTDETIAALERNIYLAEEYNLELVFASQIVK